jgi:hypothetical protein
MASWHTACAALATAGMSSSGMWSIAWAPKTITYFAIPWPFSRSPRRACGSPPNKVCTAQCHDKRHLPATLTLSPPGDRRLRAQVPLGDTAASGGQVACRTSNNASSDVPLPFCDRAVSDGHIARSNSPARSAIPAVAIGLTDRAPPSAWHMTGCAQASNRRRITQRHLAI